MKKLPIFIGVIVLLLILCSGTAQASDQDEDTVPDANDNCPTVYNPEQNDIDSDGIGNVCDNCPLISNVDQNDSDNDGAGNVCDHCPGSCDCNSVNIDGLDPINFLDFSILANYWLQDSSLGDMTGDTRVDYNDLLMLSSWWLWSCSDLITVNDDGIADYNSIQDAVENSNPGDIIFVYSGAYIEDVNISNKSNLILLGEDRDSVFVIGKHFGPGFYIYNSRNVEIRNFTIYDHHQGIYLLDSNDNVIDNIVAFQNTNNGICLGNSHNNHITNSRCSYNLNYHGISMELSNQNYIDNVSLTDNNQAGLFFALLLRTPLAIVDSMIT